MQRTRAQTEKLHMHTLSAVPFTLSIGVLLREAVRACPSLNHCLTHPGGKEDGHIRDIIEKQFNMGV